MMAWGRRRRRPDELVLSRPRVAVVGPCASGKSTLVAGLQAHGVDAYVCAQEHSGIPDLWRRRRPDILIMLDVDLETIRERRGGSWSEAIYRAQTHRLAAARHAAALVVDTRRTGQADTLDLALAEVERWRLAVALRKRLNSA